MTNCFTILFPVKNKKDNRIIEIGIFEQYMNKFYAKVAILDIWTKFSQKEYFQSKMNNTTIEFGMFELV